MSNTFYSFIPCGKYSKLTLKPAVLRYACDECHQRIEFGKRMFQCVYCVNYHLCMQCWMFTTHHENIELHPANISALDCFFTKRLQESVESTKPHKHYTDSLEDALIRYSERTAIAEFDAVEAKYNWITYAALYDTVQRFAIGFQQSISSLEFYNTSLLCPCSAPLVIIFLPNSLNWVVVDCACFFMHCVVIPIDSKNSPKQAVALMNDSRATILITNNALFDSVADILPSHIQYVLTTDSTNTTGISNKEKISNICVETFTDIYAKSNNSNRDTFEIRKVASKECCVSIVYTSGTTEAKPKGSIMSDKLLNQRADAYIRDQNWTLAAYISFSNSTGRHQLSRTLCNGGRLAIVSDANTLLSHLPLIRPSLFTAPPAVWNTIYSIYKQYIPNNATVAEKNIAYGKVRCLLGGNATSIGIGGSKCDTVLVKFLKDCFGDHVASEGYGCTEVGSISSNGYLCEGVKVKLLDVAEMKFTSRDKPYPRGEICVQTPTMISQYYNAPVSTLESFITIDGEQYYKTGDVGELQENGHKLVLFDRVKNYFKLSNGTFISPEHIEAVYSTRSSEYIEFILVYGSVEFENLAALIIAKPNYQNNPTDFWKNYLFDVGQKEQLQPHEIPRVVLLKNVALNQSLLTPTWKKRRAALYSEYLDSLRNALIMFEEEETSNSLSTISSNNKTRFHDAFYKTLPHTRNLNLNQSFYELGGNSIAAIRFMHSISLIDEEFRERLQLKDLLETGSIEELFQTKSKRFNDSVSDNTEETKIDTGDSILMIPKAKFLAALDFEHQFTILLTGATGFLGTTLLKQLLIEFPKAQIICLLHKRKLNIESRRVVSLFADITQPHLGISEEQYKYLQTNVNLIIHNAACVNFLYSYSHLYEVNTKSTANLLNLGNDKYFCYISTQSVQNSVLSGYAQSKFASEQLILANTEKDNMSRWIVRPCTIVGDGKEEHAPEFDFFKSLYVGLQELKIAPPCTNSFFTAPRNLLPVDIVSQQIIASIRNRTQQIIPLTNGIQYTLKEFLPEIKSCESCQQWNRIVAQIPEDHTLEPFRQFLYCNRKCRLYGIAEKSDNNNSGVAISKEMLT